MLKKTVLTALAAAVFSVGLLSFSGCDTAPEKPAPKPEESSKKLMEQYEKK